MIIIGCQEFMTGCGGSSNAVVYDFGSSRIKFGHAGDIQPLFSVLSAGARYEEDGEMVTSYGDQWLEHVRPGLEVVRVVDDTGMLCPKESETLWSFLDWTYGICLGIDPADHPVLVTQPTHLAKQKGKLNTWRCDFAEQLFEFAEHPAVCFEYDSVLACYSHAVYTGLVVDFGWSCTRVVPVFEGNPLFENVSVINIGGNQISELMEKDLTKNGKRIYTNLDLNLKRIGAQFTPTESQSAYCRRTAMGEFIRSNFGFRTPQKAQEFPAVLKMYPDERKDVRSHLTNIASCIIPNGTSQSQSQFFIHEQIYNAIQKSPADLRGKFWFSIICCGGMTKSPGFIEQLGKVAAQKVKGFQSGILHPIDKIASGPFAVWEGGSILASVDTFPSMCVTKERYKEEGPHVFEIPSSSRQ